MKKRPINSRLSLQKGFTLVELLTVMAIIAVLAGLTIGVLNLVQKANAKKETSVRLARLKNATEQYASDNSNIYPFSEDVLSKELYKSLSGDFTGTGVTKDSPPEGEVYWADLLNVSSGLVKKEAGGFVIIDKYNNSFRYRSGVDLQGNPVPEARNADFDAWSLGADGKPTGLNVDSNLKSDETKDDIWQ